MRDKIVMITLAFAALLFGMNITQESYSQASQNISLSVLSTQKPKKKRAFLKQKRKKFIDESYSVLTKYCPQYANNIDIDYLGLQLEETANIDTDTISLAEETINDFGYHYISDENINDDCSGYKEFDERSVFADHFLRSRLIENINDWMGTRYRMGGRSKQGIDCSNFTSVVIKQTLDLDYFPAGAANQSRMFKRINDLDDLQFGDLIFFSGANHRSSRIGHVGIYIGNGVFAHSSSAHMRGVVYTHISDGIYDKRFRFGGRFIKEKWADKMSFDFSSED